ncbi:hypothetical protein OIU74_015934 [Salix koriyanagi]|uniref:Uncharacterized protein n=1 Tax=Salix koriyanagi TaxID=2511006 RepID=A0A9Q0PNZ8_9ROSI|nr:hypothetical protein OIU74_015934 [Salix koriyanagi]
MGYEGRSFEARYHKFLHQTSSSMPSHTERTSIGLNVALETAVRNSIKAAAAEGLQESNHAFDIPQATVAPCLGSGFLKGLKYS